jgi:hypothetical protein
MCLSNLAEQERDLSYARFILPISNRESHKYNLAHLNLELTRFNRSITGYQRDTILALIEAAKHPEYSLIHTMRDGYDNEISVRDSALFFGTLHQLDVSERLIPMHLYYLSTMSGVDDLSVLHGRSPEGANALLRLSYHVSTKSETITSNDEMHPELLEMVMNHPEKTDALIDFIEQRQITTLAGLHPQLFLDAISTESQSMRGGVL